MGTTSTAILNDTGVQVAYTLIIEGYSRPLTSWHDLSAVDTAWASTDFTGGALPGLEIDGNISQRFRPFDPDLDISTLSFRVVPEEDDVFGTAVFKSTPGEYTRLASAFATGDTTLSVKDNTSWPSSGTLYIGAKALTYTAKPTSTGFTIAKNGAFSAFQTNSGAANVFPTDYIPNSNESVGGWKNTAPPLVSDHPKDWVGKPVGLYIHRVVAGVLDTSAQAELLFAGRIESVGEDGDGATVLNCEDFRINLEEHTVLSNQWQALAKEGFLVVEGQWFDASIGDASGTINKLVATTGASGSYEFEPGYYTAAQLADIISAWLNAGLATANWTWDVGIVSTPGGLRFQIQGARGAAATIGIMLFWCSDRRLLEFLGFSDSFISVSDYPGQASGGLVSAATTSTIRLQSQSAPYRIMPPVTMINGFQLQGFQTPPSIQVTSPMGTYHDLTSDLPPEVKENVSSGEGWSFFSANDKVLFLGKVDSLTAPTEITDIRLGIAFSATKPAYAAEIFDIREGRDLPVIKQVIALSGRWENIITRLMASIDGNGTNHATYDDLPTGIGAGIPWSLLGQNWLDSLNDIEESTDDSTTIIVEKPTRLWDLIAPDLMMRNAFLVFKDGGYQLATMQVPNASNADWTLDEDARALPMGRTERTMVQHTSEYLISQIKISFNREPLSGEYRDNYIAIGSDISRGKVITIKARNSYSDDKGNGEGVISLAEALTAQHLSVFNRPVRRWKKSISPQLFLAAPGDTVAFSDNWARNPTNGTRGVTTRGATVLSISYSFGVATGGVQQMNGSMELLFSDEDRTFPMSYALESKYSLGASAWDSGNKRLYVQDHAFSRSTDSNDYTHATTGDAVRVLEIDPASPASPDTFTDTISATGTNGTGDYIELTTGFGSPAFDSTKIYAVFSDTYDNAGTNQQAFAYQADDADGYIGAQTIEPNLYGKDQKRGHGRPDITRLPSRHSTSLYGDGVPITPAQVDQGIRMHNNLINYRTAPGCASFGNVTTGANLAVATWTPVDVRPFYIGDGRFGGGRTRKLVVGPAVRWEGSDLDLRLRIVSQPPWGDDTTFVIGAIGGPVQSFTWNVTTTSTVLNLSTEEMTVVRADMDKRTTFLVLEAYNNDGSAAFLYWYGYHCLYMKELA